MHKIISVDHTIVKKKNFCKVKGIGHLYIDDSLTHGSVVIVQNIDADNR